MRAILLKDKVNLLSVTIRYVPKNTESFVSYSRTESYAFVLYINQKMSEEGKRDAEDFTQELVTRHCNTVGRITFLTSDTPGEHRFERPTPSWTHSSRRRRGIRPQRHVRQYVLRVLPDAG